jgi:hypothetical protein
LQEIDNGLLMEVHILKMTISRGSLNTIKGILKFLQEMHVTVANQQQEMPDETHLKILIVLQIPQYTFLHLL